MPAAYDDDDEDWGGDDFDDYGDDDGGSLTIECPACGESIYEDAVQCPECGEYITHGNRAWEGRPLWWVILGLAGIVAVIYSLVGW